jgi:YD repeat-containing protein
MLAVIAIAACTRPLAPGEWREQVPRAPCEVHIVDTDGNGSFDRIQRYDAGGHLVFGTTRLSYDGRGREYLTWDGPRLVRADSYDEREGGQEPCDLEGGCDEPATRTIARMTLDYDGDRLTRTDRTDHEFDRDERGIYVLRERRYYSDDIAYDGDRVVGYHGTIHWDNHHPLERHNKLNTDTLEWSGDRLDTYRWPPFMQTFAYDDRGRLASERMTGPETDATTTWSYDESGRLFSRVTTSTSRRYEWAWTYDDVGRVVRATSGSASSTVYTYGASCPAKLNAPALPTALGRAGLVVCARSPGDLYNTCD